MEGKKGRMNRVYTAPGVKASPEAVKKGGRSDDPGKGKMPSRGERTSKHKGKMGG
jgi:hypothetical protein